MGRKKGQFTMESWVITNGNPGDTFYSEKTDRHLTAIASHRKRKIKTERIITITTGGKIPQAMYITKVIILE